MQQIEKNDNVITYNGYTYEYISYDIIDDMCVHISMKPLWYETDSFQIISLLVNDTIMNGKLVESIEDFEII